MYAPWVQIQMMAHSMSFCNDAHCDGPMFKSYMFDLFAHGFAIMGRAGHIKMSDLSYAKGFSQHLADGSKGMFELVTTGKSSYIHRFSWLTAKAELLGYINFMQVFVDMSKHKSTSLPEFFMTNFAPHSIHQGYSMPDHKMQAPSADSHVTPYVITDRDLDSNNHVNSAVYMYVVGLVVDEVWTKLHGKDTTCRIDDYFILLNGEFLLGEQVDVRTDVDGNIYHINFCNAAGESRIYVRAEISQV